MQAMAKSQSDTPAYRMREGRNNRYTVNESLPLRHPVESHCTIAELIKMVIEGRLRIARSREGARVAIIPRSSPVR